MAKKEKDQITKEVEENGLDIAPSGIEGFINENRTALVVVISIVVLLVVGFILFKKVYMPSVEEEAQAQMFMAEQYFERDSFNLAINGDGMYSGFLTIIDDYGISKSGNLAKFYAGVSYLNLHKYDEAITYLKDFDGSNTQVASIAKGAIGDAYVETNKLEEAVKYYKEAAGYDDVFTSPIYLKKAGLVLEELGKLKEALAVYNTIKEKYPKSTEGRTIEKYIVSLEMKQ